MVKEDNATHPMTVDLVGTMHVALGFAKKTTEMEYLPECTEF